ncbi:nucleotidyltransferase family protein [Aromatoleum sp.]|uniref:nucleotidyltransferase family protein n=1 Tax=Aromatoleum sp. TaxID=2307007 RepID=UPI002FC58D13
MNEPAFADLHPLDQLIRAAVTAVCDGAEMSDAWKHLQQTPLDWRDVYSQVARLEVGPMVYRGLQYVYADRPLAAQAALGREDARPLERALYRSYVDTVRVNTALYDQLAQLVQEATRCNLKIVVLKGAYLAKYAYDDFGLRPMSDIDILVRGNDLDAAERMMCRLGYRYIDGPQAPGVWRNEHFHLNPFAHPEHPHAVEVHFQLTHPNDKVRFDSEALWARAVPIHSEDGPVLALDTLDLLLHLAVHSCYLDKLAGPSLRQTCDVARVVNRMHAGLDWEELARRAANGGATAYIYLALELARLVCGAKVPEEFTAHLRPSDFPKELIREGINRVFHREYSLPISSTLAAFGIRGLSRTNLQHVFRSFSSEALHQQYGPGAPPLLAFKRVFHLTRRYGKSVIRLCLRDMEARAAVHRVAGLDDRLA